MKNININIDKSIIFRDVSLNSAYAGAKNTSENGFFERVATIEADEELLSHFWTDMCGLITDRLRAFVTSAEQKEDSLHLTLEVSGSYDDSLTPSVISDLFAAMTAGISARWFSFTFPQQTTDWKIQSNELLNRVIGKLCHRKRPTRSSEES